MPSPKELRVEGLKQGSPITRTAKTIRLRQDTSRKDIQLQTINSLIDDLHFDTRQLNRIIWHNDSLDDFAKKITARTVALRIIEQLTRTRGA